MGECGSTEAQRILGASSLYASQHGGALPGNLAQLENGNLNVDGPAPPTAIGPYKLISDKEGVRVLLVLGDSTTCNQIEELAHKGSSNAPYGCAQQNGEYVVTFRS